MTDLSKRRRWALAAFWLVGLVGALGLQFGGTTSHAPAALDAAPATVLAPRTARIASTLHVAGDVLDVGTVVVTLDPAELDLELALQKVELERLQNEVLAQVLEVKGSDFEAGARLEIEAERAAQDLTTLLSDEKRDRAELDTLDAQIARQNALIEKKLASAEQRDELVLRRSAVAEQVAEAVGAVKSARAREAAANKRLSEWRSSHNVADDERSAPERAAVRAQEERIKQLEQRRAALEVKSPIAGVLSEVLVADGGTAREGEALFVVMPQRADRATAWVDEADARMVRIGDRAELRPVDGAGAMRSGAVRALGAGVIEIPRRFWSVPGEPQFGRAVFIELAGQGGDSVPGQRMDARFSHE